MAADDERSPRGHPTNDERPATDDRLVAISPERVPRSPTSFRYACSAGPRTALRVWLILPLYFGALALALLQTWPLGLAVTRGALRSPFLGELAGGGGDALADLFLGAPMAGSAAGLWSFALLPLTALLGLLYNFCSGGVLSVWAAGPPRTFWAGFRRYFWAFTGLGVLLVMLAVLLIAGVALLGRPLGAGVQVIVAAVLLQVLNLLGEYARAIGVARDRRNPLRLLAMAADFCMRHLPGVLLLALLGLLLHSALAALYLPVARVLGGSPLVVIWQQLVLFAWLWIKFLRLAWALRYVEGQRRL